MANLKLRKSGALALAAGALLWGTAARAEDALAVAGCLAAQGLARAAGPASGSLSGELEGLHRENSTRFDESSAGRRAPEAVLAGAGGGLVSRKREFSPSVAARSGRAAAERGVPPARHEDLVGAAVLAFTGDCLVGLGLAGLAGAIAIPGGAGVVAAGVALLALAWMLAAGKIHLR